MDNDFVRLNGLSWHRSHFDLYVCILLDTTDVESLASLLNRSNENFYQIRLWGVVSCFTSISLHRLLYYGCEIWYYEHSTHRTLYVHKIVFQNLNWPSNSWNPISRFLSLINPIRIIAFHISPKSYQTLSPLKTLHPYQTLTLTYYPNQHGIKDRKESSR